MVYRDPVWKQEKFFLGLDRSKLCVLCLGPKDKNAILDGTFPSCTPLHRSQIFKQKQIVLIHWRLIVFLLIWALEYGVGWGWVGLSAVHTHTLSHTHTPSKHSITLQTRECQITKHAISVEWIKIIWFSLIIYELWSLPYMWVGVWVGGWLGGWVGWWVKIK